MSSYHRPTTTEEALEILSQESCIPLAGGTDFYPARVGKPIQENVMDLTGIRSLRGIEKKAEGIWMGALTTWTDVMHADLPKAFRGLQQASKTIGGVQTQNAGTLCGNLCNASPAADSAPNLMALEALVELQSMRGIRRLNLHEFILGNRKTAKAPDELVTGIFVPHPSIKAVGAFEKLGGHNPIEPAKFGVAIFSGANFFNFEDDYYNLIKSGAAMIYEEDTLLNLILSDKKIDEMGFNARKCVEKFGGASEETLKLIERTFANDK